MVIKKIIAHLIPVVFVILPFGILVWIISLGIIEFLGNEALVIIVLVLVSIFLVRDILKWWKKFNRK